MNKNLFLLLIIIGSLFTFGNQFLSIKSIISDSKKLAAFMQSKDKNRNLNLKKIKKFLNSNNYYFDIKTNTSNIVLVIKSNEVPKITSFLNNEIKLNHLSLISYKVLFKDKVYQMEFVFCG